MTLLAAHQILVAAALALAGIVCCRGFVRFGREAASVDLAMGIGGAVAAVVLAVYLGRVRKKYLAERARPRAHQG